IFREAQNEELEFYGDPFDTVVSYSLGQLIYDSDNVTEDGVLSALRGHSLARSLYGDNSAGTNQTPFNGSGWLHYNLPNGVDNASAVNYTYFKTQGDALRDPEYTGAPRASWTAPLGTYSGGVNVPYTYPDHNNMYLAAVNGDGQVLVPSFHRPWLGFGSLDP